MNSCKLDHSNEDVQKKLTEQKPYLLEEMYSKCLRFLTQSPTQQQLNELFHLLKKYDLATDNEKSERNQKLDQLL